VKSYSFYVAALWESRLLALWYWAIGFTTPVRYNRKFSQCFFCQFINDMFRVDRRSQLMLIWATPSSHYTSQVPLYFSGRIWAVWSKMNADLWPMSVEESRRTAEGRRSHLSIASAAVTGQSDIATGAHFSFHHSNSPQWLLGPDLICTNLQPLSDRQNCSSQEILAAELEYGGRPGYEVQNAPLIVPACCQYMVHK